MSLQKPQTEDELMERIVQDILHDYILESIRKMKWRNYTAHHRWLILPFDDLEDLYPDIRQGPEQLRKPQLGEDHPVIREFDLREFLRDDHITPWELGAFYGLDNDAVRERFGKRFKPMLNRILDMIREEFPALRMSEKLNADTI